MKITRNNINLEFTSYRSKDTTRGEGKDFFAPAYNDTTFENVVAWLGNENAYNLIRLPLNQKFQRTFWAICDQRDKETDALMYPSEEQQKTAFISAIENMDTRGESKAAKLTSFKDFGKMLQAKVANGEVLTTEEQAELLKMLANL